MPLTPAITDKFLKVGTPGTATTLSAPGYTNGVSTSINVGSTTNWPTDTPVPFAIDRAQIVNGIETRVVGSYCEFFGIVSSASVIGSLTKTYGTGQDYAAGSLTRVYIPVTSTQVNYMVDGLNNDHTGRGYHKTLHDTNGNEMIEFGATASAVNQVKTINSATGTPVQILPSGDDTNINLLMQGKGTGAVLLKAALPQGLMMNGKIVTSVTSNNITVAIKTLDGSDPSAANPVFIRIGTTIRTLQAALSVTKNAGTNWFSKGASIFATNESDFFVYLCWNTTDSAITIAFSSTGSGRTYADFSTTNTNWNYWAGSGSAPASTDEVENVGRFNATLGATASFNWSIPATSIIINRPTLDTRIFSYTNSGSAAGTFYFQQKGVEKRVWGFTSSVAGGASSTYGVILPPGFLTTVQGGSCSVGGFGSDFGCRAGFNTAQPTATTADIAMISAGGDTASASITIIGI